MLVSLWIHIYLMLPSYMSKEGWPRKIINLGIATVSPPAFSLSWAIVVDLVPADQRPYIGSSGDNTVMGLIFGHNGISRLEGGGVGKTPPASRTPQPFDQTQGEPGT